MEQKNNHGAVELLAGLLRGQIFPQQVKQLELELLPPLARGGLSHG